MLIKQTLTFSLYDVEKMLSTSLRSRPKRCKACNKLGQRQRGRSRRRSVSLLVSRAPFDSSSKVLCFFEREIHQSDVSLCSLWEEEGAGGLDSFLSLFLTLVGDSEQQSKPTWGREADRSDPVAVTATVALVQAPELYNAEWRAVGKGDKTNHAGDCLKATGFEGTSGGVIVPV